MADLDGHAELEARPTTASLPRGGRGRWMALVRVLLGAALLWFVLSRTGDSARDAVGRLLDAPWVLLLLFSLPLIGNVLEAARMVTLVEPIGIRLRLLPTCGIVAIATLFNWVVPGGTGGDVMKLFYVGRTRERHLTETATALLLDRAIALFTVLLVILAFAGLALPVVREYAVLRVFALGSALGVVGLVFLWILSTSKRLRRTGLYRFLTLRAPLHHQFERLGNAIAAFGDRPGAVLRAMGLCLIGHALLVWAYVALGSVLAPGLGWEVVALLCLLGMLANAIPVTPGGLGVGEAVFERLFALVGVSGGAFLMVAWRVGMLPLAMLGFAVYTRGLGEITREATS